MKIAENLAVVRKKMAEACERAGRNPEDVTLISVGKTKPVSMLLEEIGRASCRERVFRAV